MCEPKKIIPDGQSRLRRIVRDPRPYTGLGRTQTEQLIKEGKHPIPVRISARARGFFEDELIAFQQSRPRISKRDKS